VVNSVKDYGVHLLGTDVSAFPLTPYIVIAVPNSGAETKRKRRKMLVIVWMQVVASSQRTLWDLRVTSYSVAPPIQADVGHGLVPVNVRQGSRLGDF
jgi:hypothetical protein